MHGDHDYALGFLKKMFKTKLFRSSCHVTVIVTKLVPLPLSCFSILHLPKYRIRHRERDIARSVKDPDLMPRELVKKNWITPSQNCALVVYFAVNQSVSSWDTQMRNQTSYIDCARCFDIVPVNCNLRWRFVRQFPTLHTPSIWYFHW